MLIGGHEPYSTSAKLKKHHVLSLLINYIRDKQKSPQIIHLTNVDKYAVIGKERFQLTQYRFLLVCPSM